MTIERIIPGRFGGVGLSGAYANTKFLLKDVEQAKKFLACARKFLIKAGAQTRYRISRTPAFPDTVKLTARDRSASRNITGFADRLGRHCKKLWVSW